MNPMELKLCDIQGRLFENSGKAGYGSEDFIQSFMKSDIAKGMDATFNHYQWAGEEYLLDALSDTIKLNQTGPVYPNEVLYWSGYLYRYWHILKNISSQKIIRVAPAKTMNRNYLLFHTLDPESAIDNLIEIYEQKHHKD